jgi:hypothetical protein
LHTKIVVGFQRHEEVHLKKNTKRDQFVKMILKEQSMNINLYKEDRGWKISGNM